MGPMDDLINTALRNVETERLVEELNGRFDKVEISGIKSRMNQHIRVEAENSPLTSDEVKSELAKHWLEV